MLADLTLELLPSISEDFANPGNVDFFPLHLFRNPVLQTTEMNKSHRAVALASAQQGVLLRTFGHPTEFALPVALLATILLVLGNAVNCCLLLVKLFGKL